MFHSLLKLEEVPGTHSFVRLSEPLRYADDKHVFIVPAGFETDLASVPRLLWTIFPPWGPWAKAAVLHDYLYRTKKTTRREADRLFRATMKGLGVRWRRYPMWAAVRLFGWLGYGAKDG